MKEETGLDIQNPRLCGIKQFLIENGRYIVFLFHIDEFFGEVTSSEEGEKITSKAWRTEKGQLEKEMPTLRSERARACHDLAFAEVISYNRANLMKMQ